LTLVIVVRIHVPEPRGAPRLVLGMLLQSIAARFDSEAPYHAPPTSGEEPGLMNLADGFDTRAADILRDDDARSERDEPRGGKLRRIHFGEGGRRVPPPRKTRGGPDVDDVVVAEQAYAAD
jgi:hypothetical protein